MSLTVRNVHGLMVRVLRVEVCAFCWVCYAELEWEAIGYLQPSKSASSVSSIDAWSAHHTEECFRFRHTHFPPTFATTPKFNKIEKNDDVPTSSIAMPTCSRTGDFEFCFEWRTAASSLSRRAGWLVFTKNPEVKISVCTRNCVSLSANQNAQQEHEFGIGSSLIVVNSSRTIANRKDTNDYLSCRSLSLASWHRKKVTLNFRRKNFNCRTPSYRTVELKLFSTFINTQQEKENHVGRWKQRWCFYE